MSELPKICDICGGKAVIMVYTKRAGAVQKVFYCCSKISCLNRIKSYAKERGETVEVVEL